MPAQLTELKVRGVAIKLYRSGRGPTVLFLDGAGGVPQWLPFFEALAERYELLVPDHPGFGGSDDPPWIHSMPDLAMFYLDLIEETGLDRIHVIGSRCGPRRRLHRAPICRVDIRDTAVRRKSFASTFGLR
jgi:pimeloyl-ACP methyl ester carboxylesterase